MAFDFVFTSPVMCFVHTEIHISPLLIVTERLIDNFGIKKRNIDLWLEI